MKLVLTLILTGSSVLLVIGLIQPYLLKVEMLSWNVSTNIDRPGSKSRLRILLLSDLHAEFIFIRLARIINEINLAHPDVIVFAGDWTGQMRRGAISRVIRWQKCLSDTAKKADIPIFAVAGNHDNEFVRALLQSQDSGIRLLLNEAVRIKAQDESCWQIIGIDDLKYGQPELPAYIEHSHEKTVVVAHNPDMLLHLPELPGRFFLSGHFHGGQIWTPGRLEFKLLRKEEIAARGIYRGEFSYNSKLCYISRGLGCVVMPIRLFSRPELTVIDLIADKT